MFVLRAMVVRAGIERVVSDKMNFLANRGHEVTLVTCQQGCHPMVFKQHPSVRHEDVDCRFFTIYRYSLPFRLLKQWQMKWKFKQRFHQLVRQLQPDVIVTVTNLGEFVAEIMSAPCGKKIIEAHGAFLAITAAQSFRERLHRWQLLRAVRRSDLVITLTQMDKPYWQPYARQVVAVPNPVTFYSDDLPATERQHGRILCVGRLEQQKRFDRLVDAFAMIASRYPDWYVDIYGTGEDEAALSRQIDSCALTGRVCLRGHSEDIYSEYRRSEFFVLSSDYEGFGLVLVEAMACGVPVVSVDCPFGPSEIIGDGVDGLLCQPDAADLAAKMEWMITHEAERRKMGIAAHHSVVRYRKETVLPQWEKAYKKTE